MVVPAEDVVVLAVDVVVGVFVVVQAVLSDDIIGFLNIPLGMYQ
jgi:hypothetical protein